jgi:hypothetical protein
MGVVEKKIWPEFFERMLRGEKNVELRLADFDLKTGDILILKEWDPIRQRYSGRTLSKVVKNLQKINLTAFWDLEKVKKNGLYLIEF